MVFGGTSLVTTLPAPTMAFSPTVMPPRRVAPEPIEAPRLTSVLWTAPIRFRLRLPAVASGPGIAIIDESHTVPDENFGFNRDPSQMKVWLEILQRSPIFAPF